MPLTPPPSAPTEPGDVPSRSNPITFRALADSFVTWQVGFRSWLASFAAWAATHVTELNSFETQMGTYATVASNAASSAATSSAQSFTYKGQAAASAVDAAASAAAAAASASGGVFLQSGAGAVQRDLQDKMREAVSVKDFGATGNGVTNDAAAIQAAIDAVSGSGSTYLSVHFPDGVYLVNSTITQKQGVTLVLEKNAIIKAGAVMSALIQTPAATAIFDVGIYGGRLHCEDKAAVGLDVQWFQHYKVQDTYIENFTSVGARFGLAGTAYSSYEAMIRGLKTFRNTGTVGVGSIGLHLRTATDCKVSQCIFGGAETGVLSSSGGHWLEQVHCWTRSTVGTMYYGFDDQAGTNTYVGCYADTPATAGFRIAFGNVALIGCRAFMNTLGGSDNVADGVLITSAAPNCTILGFVAIGANASFRLKTDINYAAVTDPYSTTHIVGTVSNNVVTKAPSFVRNTELLGLWVAGIRRMDFSLDGSANLNLKRRDSGGSLLGTPIAINNSTGQVSFQDAGIDTKGTFDKATTIGGVRVWTHPTTNLLMAKASNPASATDGSPILLKKLTGTTSGTIGVSVTVAHDLGYAPTYVIVSSRGAGAVYQSAGADATNVTIAGTAASLNFDVYVG